MRRCQGSVEEHLHLVTVLVSSGLTNAANGSPSDFDSLIFIVIMSSGAFGVRTIFGQIQLQRQLNDFVTNVRALELPLRSFELIHEETSCANLLQRKLCESIPKHARHEFVKGSVTCCTAGLASYYGLVDFSQAIKNLPSPIQASSSNNGSVLTTLWVMQSAIYQYKGIVESVTNQLCHRQCPLLDCKI